MRCLEWEKYKTYLWETTQGTTTASGLLIGSLSLALEPDLVHLTVEVGNRPRLDRLGIGHELGLPLQLPLLEVEVIEGENVVELLEAERLGSDNDLKLHRVVLSEEMGSVIFGFFLQKELCWLCVVEALLCLFWPRTRFYWHRGAENLLPEKQGLVDAGVQFLKRECHLVCK